MIKRILLAFLGSAAVCTIFFYLHGLVLSAYEAGLPFSLLKSYTFHFVFFVIAVLIIEVVFLLNPAQLGFSYLVVVFCKLGAVVVVFKEALFDQESLAMAAKLSLIVPLLLFIVPEAIYCAKMLKKVDENVTESK
ncbi:MAG: DUF6168 family protein [Bacteroidota bacterium]